MGRRDLVERLRRCHVTARVVGDGDNRASRHGVNRRVVMGSHAMNQPPPTALRWMPACVLLVACADTVAGIDGAVGPGGRDAGGDVSDVVDGGGWPLPRDPRAPRLIAPLSTSYTTHRRPTLRWELPPGAAGSHVQVCRDRAYSQVELELRVSERSARPAEELPPGIHFWRVFGTDAGGSDATPPSFVWEFFAPHRSTPRDNTRGQFFDVNGDGYADVAFAVERDGFAVYFGRPGGPAEMHSQYFHSREGESNIFTACPNMIGDVNGDGYGDVLWGCNLTAPDLPSGAPRRAAEVLFGSPLGLVRSAPPRRLTSDGGWYSFGEGTTSIGDSNQDGYGDFAIGATWTYLDVGVEGQERPRPLIHYGGSAGPEVQPVTRLERPETMASFWGLFLEGNMGDLNGDGFHDLLVGESSLQAGRRHRAYLFLGTEHGLSQRAASALDGASAGLLAPRVEQNRLGSCDLNGDGLADVALNSGDERGSLVAFFMGRSLVPPTWQPDIQSRPEVLLENPAASAIATTCAFDFNGDGYSDLFGVTNARIAAFTFAGAQDISDARWGEVTVQLDDPSGAPFRVIDFTAGGDVDGDGLSDLVVAHIFGETWVIRGNRVSMLEGYRRLRPPEGLDYEGRLAF